MSWSTATNEVGSSTSARSRTSPAHRRQRYLCPYLVRSTEGYYVPFAEAGKLIPCLPQVLSKQQYYNHRAYNLYGLGRILHNEFYLDHIVN